MVKGFANIADGQVSYREEGKGEPLLLLHQTPWSSDDFVDMMAILSKKYRCIAMDTLGYGNSDTPSREYELEDFARSVVRFLDALKIKKVSIVGHHTGSKIAVEVAASHPERVNKMVLSGLSVQDPEEAMKTLEMLESHQKPPAADGEFILNIWRLINGAVANKKKEILIKGLVYNLEAYLKPYDAHRPMARYKTKERMVLVKCPVLALSGTEDMFLKYLDVVKQIIPNCQTQLIQGGGVALPMEKPEELAAAVMKFIG
jgi:pimeloyl-ACP methyl ester carboxylesterase